MNGGQTAGGHVADAEKMAQVGSGIVSAKVAVASAADRFLAAIMNFFVGGVVGIKLRLIDIDVIYAVGIIYIKAAMAGVASGENAIKNLPA